MADKMIDETILVQPLESKVKVKSKVGYLQELKEELKKVSWTSRSELILCTKIVVASIFCLGFSIYLVDLVVRGSLNGLQVLLHKVLG